MSSTRRLPDWFAPVLGGLVVEVFFLIALGGAVRTMNAGLACPDWPLCFGDVIPDYHPQVYLEFLHRAMAGIVAITTGVLAIYLWRSDAPKSSKYVMAFTVVLLLAQIVFGGLTVLLQLHAGVVATHLGMGTGFFGLLLWLYLGVKKGREAAVTSDWQRIWSVVVIAGVFAQILLGGLVASHYAANVCPDFPTCQGQWIPTLKGPVGLQVIHRLNAYLLFILIAVNWVLNRDASPRAKSLASGMLAMVLAQIGLGIANVFLHTPPLISVLHLALATAILSLAVRQLYMNHHARDLIRSA
ncbi:MAG: COX15/CtaA family protein [Bdellovibrionales bacterium]|nr:COX15/CtaA family protein [Bdellovibrionales bacterium]